METNNKLQQVLDIGIALTSEKDTNKLFHLIIQTAMELTGSDAGTLYILRDDALKICIMRTLSKGIDIGANGDAIALPHIPLKKENICAYAAITKKSLNIADVYNSDLFDFSGPKRYDQLNGYHTQSMAVVPMLDVNDKVIGVVQLMNAIDMHGNIRPFTTEECTLLHSLTSQAAIALSNAVYLEEITQQMWSFTEALTEAIDARTPYNASHTRNVAGYAISIVDHINEQFRQGKSELFFTEEHKNQIVMAAYLHDIGKLIVPLSVMNKQTRLGSRIQDIQSRLTIIELKYRVDRLSGAISEAEALQAQQRIDKTRALVQQVNDAPFLTDAVLEQVKTASAYHYIGPSQQETIPFLTSSELDCLMIRKGTLTDEERRIMESHVEMTERILSKVRFNHSFAMAPVWAAQHHEHLNGKGYPRGLSQEELGIEARILAVADICDALLAADRPYKKPLPQEKAFAIMDDMAKNGMIDANIVGYMKACLASAE